MSKSILASVIVLASVSSAALAEDANQPPLLQMFDAVEAGQIEARVIPKNASQATILLENKTNQPLSIELPEAFAGVHAQIGGGGGRVGGLGGGGGAQGIGGGGLGGGIGGGGRGGGGGGVFNVAPDSIRKVKVATVCLEHGKDDPTPRMVYVLKPIEEFTTDAKVIEICKRLGAGDIETYTAQAAVWHLTAGLSWDQLATKIKTEHLNGSVELFFQQQHIAQAVRLVSAVSQHVADDGLPQTHEPYYVPAN